MVLQTRSKSSPLLRLPLEIQTSILSEVTLSSTQSIQAVLRTCKQLYDIALPLSVHTFRNLGDEVDEGETEAGEEVKAETRGVDNEVRPSRNMMFLRYITITKPNLAQFVRCLIFGDFMTESSGDCDSTKAIGDEVVAYQNLIEKTFTESDTSDWEAWRSEWLESLVDGIEDAQVSLLLIACPNLEQLFFGEPYEPLTFTRVIKTAGKRSIDMDKQHPQKRASLPLRRLKDIYLESQETKYGYLMWSQYAQAFSLQGLRSFEVVMANGSEESAEEFDVIPPGSSNVERIILRKSCIMATVLRSMTRACKAIRSFEYTRGVYHMYDVEMMPRDVLEAMLPHARTLVYLHVNFEDDWQKTGWEDHPERLYMGLELKQMTALKKLVVGMQSLIGMLDCQPEDIFSEEVPLEVDGAPKIVECIPDNLEHLEIHGCGKVILPQAQELLDALANGKYPKLQCFRLLFNSEHIKRNDIDLQCDPTVVALDIRLQSKDNRTYDLIPYSRFGGHVQNVCTRIYSHDARDRWLNYRCSDIGRATVNGGVYYEPGFGSLKDGDSEDE